MVLDLLFGKSVEDITKNTIDNWKPRNCKKEADYRTSLAKKLSNDIGSKANVIEEHSYTLSKADIAIEKKKNKPHIIVELKHNYTNLSEHKRLIGQIEEYSDIIGLESLIIVVCGKDIKANLKKELIARIQKKNDDEMNFGMISIDKFFVYFK